MTENTTPEARREAAAEPAADQPMLYWNVPVLFHSLGLELPEEDREAHIAEVAREVWVGGTDFQRDTVASWYRDIARTAAAAGAVYSGFLLGGLDDGRISTGTLVIQVDQVDTADAEAVAGSIEELLSLEPANEVFTVDAPVGPVVVAAYGTVNEFDDGEGGRARLELAGATAYIPVPQADTLVTMTVSTPTLSEFADYMTALATVVESVELVRPGEQRVAPALSRESADRITEMFG
ncbi:MULTISPECIES: hypothetical protein [Kitasatospora]|uniref:Uncharacterized protein n=1 Tax=Kitasatospora setae (strain ATCC 33774 / DSM 43861 / JCM 3304 / KCC A-0304 / NBRC 14216 / KM-6054) TaxID=452652 RepID=E4NFV3_KITSK|nr:MULTISPECIES: hypothetical protein [Kitasatospora]BAJ30383.1 hypothetical protein KSE_46020 [Kitasatospora setae KM-6054]